MRNARTKKRRDLRKSLFSGDGFNPHSLFDMERRGRHWSWPNLDYETYSRVVDVENQLVSEYVGIDEREVYGYPMSHSPAWYRRQLNQQQRRKELHALRRAFLSDCWEDFILPRNKKDAAWYW